MGAARMALIAGFMLSMVMPIHRLPLPSFYAEWVFVAASTLGVLLSLRGELRPKVYLDSVGGLVIVFVFVIGVHIFVGRGSGAAAVFYFAYLALFLCAYQVGRTVAAESADFSWAAIALVCAALGSCVSASFQLFDIQAPFDLVMPRIGGLSANVAQINRFNDLLWLGISSTLYLSVQRPTWRRMLICAVAVLLVFSVLTGSRSSFAYACALGLLWFGLWHRSGAMGAAKVRWRAVPLLPAFVLVQMTLTHFGVFEYFHLHSATARSEPVIYTSYSTGPAPVAIGDGPAIRYPRLDLWKNIFPTLRLAGGGPGTFRSTMMERQELWDRTGFQVPPEHAHNLFVQVAAELGWPIALLLLAATALWLYRRLVRPLEAHTIWAMTIVAIIGMHSMVEYPLWYLNFLMPFAFFVGVCGGATRSQKILSVKSSFVSFVCGGVLLILGASYWQYHKVEDTLMSMQMGIVGVDREWESLREKLKEVPGYSPYKGYAQLVRVMSVEPRRFAPEDILNDCREAERLWLSVSTLATCAAAFYGAGERDEAVQSMRRACAAKPQSSADALARFNMLTDSGPSEALRKVCPDAR